MNKAGQKKSFRTLIGRFFSFLGVTLLCLLLILLGLIWVLERGPSPSVTATFTRSVRETSALRWVSNIFLSEEELLAFKSVSTEEIDTDRVNPTLIRVAEGSVELPPDEDAVEVHSIASGTCKGKMLIVKDPSRVLLGTSDDFGEAPGLTLSALVEKYDGLAGINAGGFADESGSGNGGTPMGMVITDGNLIWGKESSRYHVIGLDGKGILHIGSMTGQEALERDLRWAVSFVTHDGLASSLIINGEVQQQNIRGGINPRTAIGQREDGALLLLVLDGRSVSTLGASLQDVVDVMLSYGAVNAGNLDGGSSSLMVYDGEIINHCSSVTGPRRIPTAFIVLKEGGAHD